MKFIQNPYIMVSTELKELFMIFQVMCVHKLEKLCSYLTSISLLVVSCISPTFESPKVVKGNQSWIGFTGGIRSFDHGIPDEYSRLNSKGVVISCGFNYGFTENIGIASAFLVYIVNSEEGQIRKSHNYLSLCLTPKFEFTNNKSPVIFSTAIGLAYPEILKTQLMFGFKVGRNRVIALGSHLSWFIPYDFFINLGPAESSGFVFYLGYRIPYFNNPQNLAVGLGHRLR